LAVVAARPSVGKSAAALNMAMSMSAAGNRVLFCSLEMSRQECLARQVAAASGIPLGHILEPDGHLTEEEIDTFYRTSGRLDTTIWYDDTPALSVGALQSKARRLTSKAGLDVIIVDYLQLMTPPPGMPNRTEEERISSISRALKELAKDLNVAVIALAQLNRQLEYRDDPRPRMADLRSSGAIEQDADTIIMLSRLIQPIGRDGRRLADMPVRFDVVKNRQGQTGATILLYRGAWTRFSDYDPFWTLPTLL
ncbi:MAG: DnaB-like helicase C-terminal domain-containing protein, partial [Desulfovibrio sp.]|nr:DnaB-like helicase C-terminal domain-containing protein [Desulfovibrio sp.]